MQVFAVKVGFAVARPPTAANTRFSHVLVDAPDAVGAQLIAAQMVASRPGVVMPVSTQVVGD